MGKEGGDIWKRTIWEEGRREKTVQRGALSLRVGRIGVCYFDCLASSCSYARKCYCFLIEYDIWACSKNVIGSELYIEHERTSRTSE